MATSAIYAILGILLQYLCLVIASDLPNAQNRSLEGLPILQQDSAYAPRQVTCPPGPFVRNATGLCDEETAFLAGRIPKASTALKAWLVKTDPKFADAKKMPVLAMAHSGGGYRSFLCSAGVTQAMDARDSHSGVAGLLQSLTYQGGISGGSWFVSTMFGNDYPTVSYLEKELWTRKFTESIFTTGILNASPLHHSVINDIRDKKKAGFGVGLTDGWARLIAYQLLLSEAHGVNETYSGLKDKPNFAKFQVPLPIITGTGIDTAGGYCVPTFNSTIYEYSPFEFGAWSKGVGAFTPMSTLGTKLNAGAPTGGKDACVAGFDNLAYAFGTSSSLFFAAYEATNKCGANTTIAETSGLHDEIPLWQYEPGECKLIAKVMEGIFKGVLHNESPELFATYPNPFRGWSGSPKVGGDEKLSLVDGGAGWQNDPINPFIQPARPVDILFVNDNSADTDKFPDGTSIHVTYLQSLPENLALSKMPEIPEAKVFREQGLNTRPTVFGCDDLSKVTIVYLPNFGYSYASNFDTLKLQYFPHQTKHMIQNGNDIATNGGDKMWPKCLACVISLKTNGTLPKYCDKCFLEYCYN